VGNKLSSTGSARRLESSGGRRIFSGWRQRQDVPRKRAAGNAAITAEITAVFQEHRGFYASPWIHQDRRMLRAELRARRGAVGVVENPLQQEF
jgi:hypothetical protein